MPRFLIFLLVAFVPVGGAHSQFFSRGQEASAMRWNQAAGANFRIIFPDCSTAEAYRFAGYLNSAVGFNTKKTRKPITVVFHPWNPQSNGFVILAPRRMELYTIPPQDLYPQPWLAQLALHEYRHAVQMDMLNHGLVRFSSILFGEQAWGLSAALVPQWFFEGDAVVAETQFSHSGRGRLPSFEQGHRTAILSGRRYSYDKWLMGSYKDYIPNHYELGYKLVAYGNLKYGANIWNNVMDYTARRPYTLVPFYFGLKQYAGVSRQQLFKETFCFLDSVWNAGLEKKPYEGSIVASAGDNSYYDERFPVFTSDSTLVVYTVGVNQSPRLATLDLQGNRKSIFSPGNIYDPIGGSDNVVVWNEYLPSYRWGQQGISKIKILDICKKRERVLNCKLQMFSPSVSKDGSTLVAVGISRNGRQRFVFYNLGSGKEYLGREFPGGVALQNPSWGDSDSVIVYSKVDSTGKSVCVYNLRADVEKVVVAPSRINYSTPKFWHRYILFSAYNSQVNNIFAIDTSTNKIYRITASRYGCESPTISQNGKLLAFSRYTPQGFRTALAALDTCIFTAADGSLGYSHPFETFLSAKPPHASVELSRDTAISFMAYRKGTHLFRFHSWAPFFYDPLTLNATNAEFKPGLTLMSQNDLSTTLAVLGVSFADGNPNYHARFVYQEWFPTFSLSADYGAQSYVYRDASAKYYPSIHPDRIEVAGSVSLPYNLTTNRFLRSIVPSITASYTNDYLYYRADSLYDRNYVQVTYRVIYYSHSPMAKRDLRPPWGKLVDFRYRNTPFEHENMGSIVSLQVKQMTPGIAPNHSLMLTVGLHKQDVKKYYMSSSIPLPRGYLQFSSERLLALSADYAFPLLYPDLALPNVLYLKRIRANVFYDWAEDGYLVYNKSLKRRQIIYEHLYSFGVDLGFDYHLFRNAFPISTTLRFGNTRTNEPFFNVFFGITINN